MLAEIDHRTAALHKQQRPDIQAEAALAEDANYNTCRLRNDVIAWRRVFVILCEINDCHDGSATIRRPQYACIVSRAIRTCAGFVAGDPVFGHARCDTFVAGCIAL